MLTYGKISVDTNTFSVTYNGKEVSLLLQEYRLLLLFINHPRHVLSYEFIIDHLWHESDKIPTYSTVRTHIKRLRQAFKKANITEEIIETVHGFGYRLKTSLEPANKPIPTPPLALMQKFMKAKGIEYLIIDQNLTVQYISPIGWDYCDYPDHLEIGQRVEDSFPELIGLEKIIQKILEGKIETFELSAVARSENERRPEYINFYLIADTESKPTPQNNSSLFIFLEDDSEQMVYRQRLVQTVNESFLLLEK